MSDTSTTILPEGFVAESVDASGRVSIAVHNHVAIVTFDRADKRNALDGQQLRLGVASPTRLELDASNARGVALNAVEVCLAPMLDVWRGEQVLRGVRRAK